ncbi:hypothetical protein [Rhodopirellula bahusiensis]|uniref:hypothetical protein n=1 Tax=Rhodopirellula bahusiensis TaxID=2014065 RepID=UPI00329944DB
MQHLGQFPFVPFDPRPDIEPGQTAEILGRRWTAGSKFPLRVTTQWIQREASIVIFGADGGASTS